MALDVQPITGTDALVAARLCNFGTGQSNPLPTHERWLEDNVRPVLAGNPAAWVDVIGHASRQWKQTGGRNSHQLNYELTVQRCKEVEQRLLTYSPRVNIGREVPEGDDESLAPNPDDGYDRAVEVLVYASRPPPRPKPPSIQSTRFEIRVVGGGSASALLQTDDYFFQIVDLVRRQTAIYFYTGFGFGISIPKIPGPGSMTKSGPPRAFTTTRAAQLYMFNSKATLSQDGGATIGPASVGGTMRLSITEIMDSAGLIFTRPGMIPIEGGWGIQMPGIGSQTEGVLALCSAILPFTGY